MQSFLCSSAARAARNRTWCFLEQNKKLKSRSAAAQTLASNLFATSIVPYAGFLYHLQKSRQAPRLMLFGFYFLLVFVLATIVAGIYGMLPNRSIIQPASTSAPHKP